jgi:hypothetical protein
MNPLKYSLGVIHAIEGSTVRVAIFFGKKEWIGSFKREQFPTRAKLKPDGVFKYWSLSPRANPDNVRTTMFRAKKPTSLEMKELRKELKEEMRGIDLNRI